MRLQMVRALTIGDSGTSERASSERAFYEFLGHKDNDGPMHVIVCTFKDGATATYAPRNYMAGTCGCCCEDRFPQDAKSVILYEVVPDA